MRRVQNATHIFARDKVRAANSAYWERKAANKNSSTTDSIGKEAGDNERTN